MAKFYKPGRIVVVTNGRYAGKKGIIIRSNFEQTKTRKFAHCLVLGLSKAPRRVTKKYLRKLESRTNRLTENVNKDKNNTGAAESLEKLKRFGVFLKTFNMNHILATTYKAADNFNIDINLNKIEKVETEIKEVSTKLNKKENEDSGDKAGIDALRKQIGELRDRKKNIENEMKVNVGTELYNRFMKGFVRTRDNTEENEKIASSEFLFSKLRF